MILNQNSHWGSLPAYSLVFMSKTMTSIANSFCNFEKVILPLRYSILSFVKKNDMGPDQSHKSLQQNIKVESMDSWDRCPGFKYLLD